MTTKLLYIFRALEIQLVLFLLVLAFRVKLGSKWFERLAIFLIIGIVIAFGLLVEDVYVSKHQYL